MPEIMRNAVFQRFWRAGGSKTTATTLTTCPQCKAPTQPHIACPSCGTYKGRHYDVAERTEHQG